MMAKLGEDGLGFKSAIGVISLSSERSWSRRCQDGASNWIRDQGAPCVTAHDRLARLDDRPARWEPGKESLLRSPIDEVRDRLIAELARHEIDRN